MKISKKNFIATLSALAISMSATELIAHGGKSLQQSTGEAQKLFGGKSGNGVPSGSYKDLNKSILEERRRNGEIIDSDTLEFLIAKNGKNIKMKYLIPTMKAFLMDTNYDEMEPTVIEIQSFFKLEVNKMQLFDSLREAKITFGSCPTGKDMCLPAKLRPEPYSDTIIDKENTLNSNMDINSFFAILLHETIHKFLGDIDHGDSPDNDYPFTRYIVKRIVENGQYHTRTFKISATAPYDRPFFRFPGSHKNLLVKAHSANHFCVKKAYSYAKNVVPKIFKSQGEFVIFSRNNYLLNISEREYAYVERKSPSLKWYSGLYRGGNDVLDQFIDEVTCVKDERWKRN